MITMLKNNSIAMGYNINVRSRKYVLTTVIIIVIILAITVIILSVPQELSLRDLTVNLSEVKLTRNASEAKFLNNEQAEYIWEMLCDIKFQKDAAYEHQIDPFFYLTILDVDNVGLEIIILAGNSIVYDKSIYRASEARIDIEYLDNVLGDTGLTP